MNVIKDLLFATMRGNSEKTKCDSTDEQFREEQKENAAKPTYASVQSDWNQTDSTAADFIKNKPFGDSPTGGDTLTWDGNTEGLVNAINMFYKVSDAIVTIDDFANGWSYVMSDGRIGSETAEYASEYAPGVVSALSMWCIAESGVGVDIGGLAFPESGIYFANIDGMHTTSVTIPGYTGFPSTKKIDPKYLPSVGGIKYVYINEDDDGNHTANATYAQIATWIKSGLDVKCIYAGTIVPLVGSDTLSEIATYISSPHHTFAVMHDIAQGLKIQIYEDDYINIKWIENIE